MSAFQLLAPAIQRALHGFKWPELRPLQVDAIEAFHADGSDLVLSAATASGKTEAAFLPILSDLAATPTPGVGAVYVGPLKALINDQFGRLEELCQHADIPVHRWHGDVSATDKKAFRNNPGGVLLITPESLESNFINYGNQLPRIYGGLRHIVIDELHSFIGDVRGMHLRSLLARLEHACGGRPRRFGLSASLADFGEAQAFLNRRDPGSVKVLRDEGGRNWKVGLRAYPAAPRTKTAAIAEDARGAAATISTAAKEFGLPKPATTEPLEQPDTGEIAEHRALAAELARVFQNDANLIFTNSRGLAEMLADRIHELERRERWQRNPFVLHHGSLSREVREEVEKRLKSGEPLTAFCTSTMEMGIDIGSVRSVGQLGPPWTVNSLVQRLGRSGRKVGQASILRMYSLDPQPTAASSLEEMLCPQLLRCIAMIELAIAGWLEPPEPEDPEYSTLIHQILSVLRQAGGSPAPAVFQTLCAEGAFPWIDPARFAKVLRALGAAGLIEQMADATLILAPDGETITGGRDFYAAFEGGDDFSVRFGAEKIGGLPRSSVPPPGEHLILNGRRWVVCDVDSKKRLVEVIPAKDFKKPLFVGTAGDIRSRVFQEMQAVLGGEKSYAYLHADAAELLAAARKLFAVAGLGRTGLVRDGTVAHFFPWAGTKVMETLHLCARADGIQIELRQLSLRYPADAAAMDRHFAKVAARDFDPAELVRSLPDRHRDKYDIYLTDDLIDEANIARRLRLEETAEATRRVLR